MTALFWGPGPRSGYERSAQADTVPAMPGFPKRVLTPAERGQHQRLLESTRKAEERWARLTRDLGYSVVAREMGLTTEAIRRRVLKILGPP